MPIQNLNGQLSPLDGQDGYVLGVLIAFSGTGNQPPIFTKNVSISDGTEAPQEASANKVLKS